MQSTHNDIDVHAPTAPRTVELVETWPPGISTRATMRISDVLTTLRAEFPALTPSKLRFLEEQGLVEPVRTAAGYRQYSLAHVERLRYVLAEQRDRYLPLRVIKEQLAELDSGLAEPVTPAPRLAASGGVGRSLHAADRLTASAVAQDAGVSAELVEALISAGVLRTNSRGGLDSWARQIVLHAAELGEHGIEPRHLRNLRSAVDREVGLVEQVVAPGRAQLGPSARARAEAAAVELGESFTQLHAAMLRQGIAALDQA